MAVTWTEYDLNENSGNKDIDSDVDSIARTVVREVPKHKKKKSKQRNLSSLDELSRPRAYFRNINTCMEYNCLLLQTLVPIQQL